MKAKIPSAALVLISALIGGRAGEISHFNGGIENIRDYLVPEPGVYGVVYNYFYTTDRLNDNNGNKVNSVTVNPGPGPGLTLGVDVNVDMYALVPAVIWVTPWKILCAKYGAYIAPSFANTSLGASLDTARGRGGSVDSSSFGVGDLYVQPVWLGWTLDHWDWALAYGFYAPIGKYDTKTVTFPGGGAVKLESPDNIGLGFWTQQFQGAMAWYPWTNKATAVTAVLTYEYNMKKKDFEIRPGQYATLNWGISQYLPLSKSKNLLLEVGPAGYDSWQITEDSGGDARNPSNRLQVHGVGGQVGLTYVPWDLEFNCHGFYEYAAENRFQGASFGVNLIKKF